MPPRDKIYTRSIVRRLNKEIKDCPDGVLFFSPFLTSQTAEIVAKAANPETSEIYTVFSAENFAAGASSLGTIRSLLASGFNIFHLHALHAKIVITKNFASVGSQNLTRGGTLNLEATLIITDDSEISYLRAQVAKWTVARRPIDATMVDHMAEHLPDIRRKHRTFITGVVHADDDVARLLEDRETERQEKRKETLEHDRISERQRVNRIRRLRDKSERIRLVAGSPQVKSSEYLRTKLITRHYNNYNDYWGYNAGDYDTLAVADPSTSFINWSVKDKEKTELHNLEKRKRYLMLLLENGRLGYPALNKGQITKFGDGLEDNIIRNLDNFQIKFDFKFASDIDDLIQWNVMVKVGRVSPHTLKRQPGVLIKGYFSLNDFDFIKSKIEENSSNDDPIVYEIYDKIKRNDAEFKSIIIESLLTPFIYEHNSIGITAKQFFKDMGNDFIVQYRKYDGFEFLTARCAIF